MTPRTAAPHSAATVTTRATVRAIMLFIGNPSVFFLGRPGLGKTSAVMRMAVGLSGYGVIPLVLAREKWAWPFTEATTRPHRPRAARFAIISG